MISSTDSGVTLTVATETRIGPPNLSSDLGTTLLNMIQPQ